jgi:hypothetical protein
MTDDRKNANPRMVEVDGVQYYMTGEDYIWIGELTSRMTLQKVRHHEPAEEMERRRAEFREAVRLTGMGISVDKLKATEHFDAEYQGHGAGIHNPCMDFPIRTVSTPRRGVNVWNEPAEHYFRVARNNALNEPATHRDQHNIMKDLFALERLANVPAKMSPEQLRALGVPEGFIGWDRPPEPSAMQIAMDMLGRIEEADQRSAIRAYQRFGVGLGNMAGLNGAPPTYRDNQWIHKKLSDPNISELHRELFQELLEYRETKEEFGRRRVDKKRKKLKRDGF